MATRRVRRRSNGCADFAGKRGGSNDRDFRNCHNRCYTLRMSKAPSVRWTREHFLIALNLYRKLPFGKLDKGNPVIIETAARMGRTSNSLAMKLCNFASLDPVQRARGIRGLPGATKQDRAMWGEFQSHLAVLGIESEQLLHDLFTRDEAKEVDFLTHNAVRLTAPSGPTEHDRDVGSPPSLALSRCQGEFDG